MVAYDADADRLAGVGTSLDTFSRRPSCAITVAFTHVRGRHSSYCFHAPHVHVPADTADGFCRTAPTLCVANVLGQCLGLLRANKHRVIPSLLSKRTLLLDVTGDDDTASCYIVQVTPDTVNLFQKRKSAHTLTHTCI